MPTFNRHTEGRWRIRFKESARTPSECTESLPADTPRVQVKAIEGQMNAAYHGGEWDPWTESWKEYKRRKSMEDSGVVDSGLTIREAISVYMDKMSARGKHNSDATRHNNRRLLERFTKQMPTPFMLASLTPRWADRFLSSLDVSDATRAEYASILSNFYSHWHSKGMIRQEFDYQYRSKPREDKIKYLTETQKNKITEYYEANRDKIRRRRRNLPPAWMDYDHIIEVMFYQGFRRGELPHLTRSDIDVAAGKVRVFGKGKKYRVVDITPPAREHFVRFLSNTSDPDSKMFQVPYHRLYETITMLAKKSLGKEFGWVSPHNLRHSCGTYWAGLGVPIATIQKLLGHSDINTTMVYAHITDEASKRHFEQASGRQASVTNITGSD